MGSATQTLVDDFNKKRQEMKGSNRNTIHSLKDQHSEGIRKLNDRRAQIDYELLSLNRTKVPNHFIFILDSSGSMAGTRWQSLVHAYNQFVKIRKSRVTTDEVSVICFDSY